MSKSNAEEIICVLWFILSYLMKDSEMLWFPLFMGSVAIVASFIFAVRGK